MSLVILKGIGILTRKKLALQAEVDRLKELLEEANIRNAELEALNNKIEGL